jgi:hypothetical protein
VLGLRAGFIASSPFEKTMLRPLMPKEARFVALFEKHAAIVVAGAESLAAVCCRAGTA